jgi:hypothetical protein
VNTLPSIVAHYRECQYLPQFSRTQSFYLRFFPCRESDAIPVHKDSQPRQEISAPDSRASAHFTSFASNGARVGFGYALDNVTAEAH